MTRPVALKLGAAALILGAALPCTAAAQDFANARIETQRVAENLYVLFAAGEDVVAGNILASIGDQGVLLVDAQFSQLVPKYEAALRELGADGSVAVVVNTHWHSDHTDGNKVLGPAGAWIVSQEDTRSMLTHDNAIDIVTRKIGQAMYPSAALPVFTFDKSMRIHFNGEAIDLVHFGPAHTAADAAVIFRSSNVVHMGDVFNNDGYPFIDAENGGSLEGIIEFCRAVLDRIDTTAIVVPGHGPVSDYRGLEDYVTMLETIHDRIAPLIASGATLQQVIASRPTAEWDEIRGDPEAFLDRSFASMTR